MTGFVLISWGLFAFISLVGAAFSGVARARPLLALHALGGGIALAGFVAATRVPPESATLHPLLAIYALALALLALRDLPAPASSFGRAGIVAGILAALAVGAEGMRASGAAGQMAARVVMCLVLAYGVAVALVLTRSAHVAPAWLAGAPRRPQTGPLWGALVSTALAIAGNAQANALAVLGIASAAAALRATSLPAFATLPRREWLAAAFFLVVLWVMGALQGDLAEATRWAALSAALWCAVRCFSQEVAAWLHTRRARATRGAGLPFAWGEVSSRQAEAAGHMTPILDDLSLRRPSRARVVARVPARRVLDAAIARACDALGPARAREARDAIVTQFHEEDSDLECDPAALADALAAVLDHGLRLREWASGVALRVHVRGGRHHVAFEMQDNLAEVAEPDAVLPHLDWQRPVRGRPAHAGAHLALNFSLARARVTVEQLGGQLLSRQDASGTWVQMTFPRRLARPRQERA